MPSRRKNDIRRCRHRRHRPEGRGKAFARNYPTPRGSSLDKRHHGVPKSPELSKSCTSPPQTTRHPEAVPQVAPHATRDAAHSSGSTRRPLPGPPPRLPLLPCADHGAHEESHWRAPAGLSRHAAPETARHEIHDQRPRCHTTVHLARQLQHARQTPPRPPEQQPPRPPEQPPLADAAALEAQIGPSRARVTVAAPSCNARQCEGAPSSRQTTRRILPAALAGAARGRATAPRRPAPETPASTAHLPRPLWRRGAAATARVEVSGSGGEEEAGDGSSLRRR
jgi:hypothetical protein